jgi:3-mercaptopyruvate sulfurtransferase SseA
MRYKFVLLLPVLVTAAVLISCNAVDKVHSQQKTQLEPETTYADGARRITIDELDKLLKNNEAVVIDVRNQSMYDSGHIPGSRLIPAGEIQNHINELPRDKMIVAYCS